MESIYVSIYLGTLEARMRWPNRPPLFRLHRLSLTLVCSLGSVPRYARMPVSFSARYVTFLRSPTGRSSTAAAAFSLSVQGAMHVVARLLKKSYQSCRGGKQENNTTKVREQQRTRTTACAGENRTDCENKEHRGGWGGERTFKRRSQACPILSNGAQAQKIE